MGQISKDKESGTLKKFKDSQIVVYGAAAIGAIVYDNLKKLGIRPYAILDKRGDEIDEFKGCEVYSVRALDEGLIDKNAVIIIAIKNVFEHSEIVAGFMEKGYNRFLFRPYASLKGFGEEEENKLNKIYDMLMNADPTILDETIGSTEHINVVEFKNISYISEAAGRVTAYIPLELVFTDLPKGSITSKWTDIPILALISHIDFFRWLSGDKEVDYKRYMEYCEGAAKISGIITITDKWRENVIKNRADVYENMNNSIQRDFGFFVKNAAFASYNNKGYFNLESGKHRAAFFAAKRMRYIPLSIKKEEYEAWTNYSIYEKGINACKEVPFIHTNAPIEYPYFYNVPCYSASFYFELLCRSMHLIVEYLSEKDNERYDFLKLNVMIAMNDNGYLGRALARCGINVYEEAMSELSDLLRLTDSSDDFDDGYDFAIVDVGVFANREKIISNRLKWVIVIDEKNNLEMFPGFKLEDISYVMIGGRERVEKLYKRPGGKDALQ